MSELYDRSISKLELGRVLDMLSQCTGSSAGKAACLDLMPCTDAAEVQRLLDQTTAAVQMSTGKGYPSFAGICDVAASLERADRGGALNPKELLSIAGVLRCARTVRGYI